MKRSTDRILTTHVGSLARPVELLDTMKEKENDQPYDHELFDRQVTRSRRRPRAPAGRERHRHRHRRRDEQGQLPRLREGPPRRLRGRDGRSRAWRRRGRSRSTTSPSTTRSTSRSTRRRSLRCAASSATGPITYVGQELLQTDIDNLKAATRRLRRRRRLHAVDGPERLRAQRVLRDARGVPRTRWPRRCARSTSAIVDAGFILQVDDPFLIDMLSDPDDGEGGARAAGVDRTSRR